MRRNNDNRQFTHAIYNLQNAVMSIYLVFTMRHIQRKYPLVIYTRGGIH